MEKTLYNQEVAKAIVFLTVFETIGQLENASKFLQQAKTSNQEIPEIYILKEEKLKAAVINHTVVVVFSPLSQQDLEKLHQRFPQHIIVPANLLRDFFIYTEKAFQDLDQKISENRNVNNGSTETSCDSTLPLSIFLVKKSGPLH